MFAVTASSSDWRCFLPIVTPEGFRPTCEVLAGNTADSTTLPQFLERIERLYGKAGRIWVTVARRALSRPARGAQAPAARLRS